MNLLKKVYEQTNDIYKFKELAEDAKNKHNGVIEYKGRVISIKAIVELQGIKRDTLKEYYELYGNIDKAIFIIKESQLKRKQALYEVISRQFGISVIELDRLLKSGSSI